ncbi:MAG: hypothetical protein OEZ40_00445 [Candidatus Bathyarchaeota archaeon]|nr:hypothetical protein [Candidatus Bathyarchaeota archaeon]
MMILSARAYKNISIKSEFAEAIEQFIKENPQFGYRSIAAFLEDSSRRRLEELKAKETRLPRMEQINCDEDGVKILDRQLHRVVDVTFKPSGIRCNIDDADNCEHIKFALEQKDVQKIVSQKRKEGWKLPDV